MIRSFPTLFEFAGHSKALYAANGRKNCVPPHIKKHTFLGRMSLVIPAVWGYPTVYCPSQNKLPTVFFSGLP